MPAEREAQHAEVIACYQTLIRGLLDITDNIVDEKIVAPPWWCAMTRTTRIW